jgi:hypothetical protein
MNTQGGLFPQPDLGGLSGLLSTKHFHIFYKQNKRKRGSVALSGEENYTDCATAAGRRIFCQILWIEGCCVVNAAGVDGS